MKARVHIVVDGWVQGVGFRFECRRLAIQFGLRGWVKNLSGGSVAIMAEGERDALDRLVTWARQGPPGARVTACRATPAPPTGEFDSFDIRF